MERRRESRETLDKPGRLRLLGGDFRNADVLLLDESANGIGLRSNDRIPISQPLLIEFEDDLFLGEACYCQELDHGFRVGVKVDHCIRGSRDLLQMAAALLPEAVGDQPDSDRRPVTSAAANTASRK
ncbi:MAG TPA: hypothetical protein DEH78_00520 [Solibacterales bacterium]|nr:hypothetical protein [Bryobacterales bacterium]